METLGKRAAVSSVNADDLGDQDLHVGGSETRLQLLQELRLALLGEPGALGGPAVSLDKPLGRIRGIASVRVGQAAMHLNQLGFTQSDQLYLMRDSLAAGRPIKPEDVQWLDAVIAKEGPDRA